MIIWNYILLGVLLTSALLVAYYDLKYQKIPIWLLLTNYISLSFLVDYALLLGLVVILYAKIKDVPIDILYLIIMGYLIIIVNSKVLAGVLLIGFIVYSGVPLLRCQSLLALGFVAALRRVCVFLLLFSAGVV